MISKCQIQNFKEPSWHFEMALNIVKQLVSKIHELFFFEVVSITNQLKSPRKTAKCAPEFRLNVVSGCRTAVVVSSLQLAYGL